MTDREITSSNTLIIISALGTMFVCLTIATAFIFLTLIASRRPTTTPPASTPVESDAALAEDMYIHLQEVVVPTSDPVTLASRLGGLDEVPSRIPEPVAEPVQGDVESFWVTNTESNETSEINATLVHLSEHVYFWIDQRVLYDENDVKRVVNTFDQFTYPRTRSVIGSEWSPGVDRDPRLHILYTHDLGPSVAGLFFSRDEYPTSVQPYSNQHEMFYLSADNVSLADDYVDSVLAHEFQHMVQWNLDRNEDTWLNEGLSELNELMLGYDPGGFEFLFLDDPDIPLLQWPSEPGASGAHYGQVFLFLTYLYDRFGVEAMTQIAQDPANGLEAINLALHGLFDSGATAASLAEFDRVFIEWGVSLALQDPSIEDGRFGLSSYPAPSASNRLEIGECPRDETQFEVHQYGIDLIRIDCKGNYTLHFEGGDFIPVLPIDAHSGDWMMWSNRGDDSNMTLTKEFDLREISGEISLEYWTWYRIEEDYDYAYLEASIDGGQSWQILQTPSSVLDDPTGNSYGWAYNGVSGGGIDPEWIREEIDLSEYGGNRLTLRFEYITDSAVNGEGILIDDLAIVGSDDKTDFENGSDGWETSGFVRLYNRIPQTFQLALISDDGEINVEIIDLPVSGGLDIPLDLADTSRGAILVVTGTSGFSWMPATYLIQIESR